MTKDETECRKSASYSTAASALAAANTHISDRIFFIIQRHTKKNYIASAMANRNAKDGQSKRENEKKRKKKQN